MGSLSEFAAHHMNQVWAETTGWILVITNGYFASQNILIRFFRYPAETMHVKEIRLSHSFEGRTPLLFVALYPVS